MRTTHASTKCLTGNDRSVEAVAQKCYAKKAIPKAAASKFSTKVGLLKNFANFTGKHLC